MRKVATFLVALCATTALWAGTSNFTPAAFTVADGKQVYFSQGNLQCSGVTTGEYVWSFAENQYDMIGEANVSDGALADKIDMFGWSANNEKAKWGISTSTDNADYSGDFVDWGQNIGDGTTYRTLTYDEWKYLLDTRTKAGDLKGAARIKLSDTQYVNGLILLPDSWDCPGGITFNSGFADDNSAYADKNLYTTEQWQQLEAAGAVFLPACSRRNGSVVRDVQGCGGYWSATPYDAVDARGFLFAADGANTYADNRYNGRAVRLVKDVIKYAITVNETENGTVKAAPSTAAKGETVTLTVAPAADYELATLTVKDASENTITVVDNKFTMPASTVTVTATFKRSDTKEYVDLGLPSGLLWATCNVGAYSPEIYGNYYAWGETEPKETYSWDTYKFGVRNAMTKYCNNSTYGKDGFTDELTTLEAEDDAAAVNWGGKWRMPTDAEWTELRENCDWTWTADYEGTGVAGCVVASKTNSNSIFLPAAGYYSSSSYELAGSYGFYGSSSLHETIALSTWQIYFGSTGSATRNYTTRNEGQPVRPVQEVVKYAITVTTPENGTVTADMTTAAAGKTVTLTIAPVTGYELETLSVKDADNNEITLSADNKFTMPASAVTVTATFKKIDYAINIASDIENGKVSVASGATTANYGDEVELTITPVTGYKLDVLSVKDAADVDVMVSADNKFIMPASAVTVSATFKKIDYAINIASDIENGKVSVASGATTANYGDEVELTITPATGYELETLSVKDAAEGDVTVSADNKFTMPASAVTVSATFKKIDYAITIASDIENGKVSVASGATIANYGDEVELTITPATGYKLETLSVKDADNNDVTVEDYKFTMPASAVTVTATFKKIDYAINIASDIENGKVSVTSGATTANYGDEVELTITPATGYELETLSVKDATEGDVTVSADNKFTMPASAVTVTATFKKTVPTALQNAEMVDIYTAAGRIYGADGMQIFTLTGQNVTEMNGSLNGVYIVKVGDKAQKVVVK